MDGNRKYGNSVDAALDKMEVFLLFVQKLSVGTSSKTGFQLKHNKIAKVSKKNVSRLIIIICPHEKSRTGISKAQFLMNLFLVFFF